jgi:hypothetical protein
MVGVLWLRAVGPHLRLDPALGNLVAELKVRLLVKAIDSLRIDRPSFTFDQDMNATIDKLVSERDQAIVEPEPAVPCFSPESNDFPFDTGCSSTSFAAYGDVFQL